VGNIQKFSLGLRQGSYDNYSGLYFSLPLKKMDSVLLKSPSKLNYDSVAGFMKFLDWLGDGVKID
jgi:hypothetical protein